MNDDDTPDVDANDTSVTDPEEMRKKLQLIKGNQPHNLVDLNERRTQKKKTVVNTDTVYQGFLLSAEQIDFVRKEQDDLVRIIKSEPQRGVFVYLARLEALKLLIQVHNVEMDKRNTLTNKP